MDFEVIIKTKDGGFEVQKFEQFFDAVGYITEKMSHWNNFTPEEPMFIKIAKVPGETEALSVHVVDEMDVADLFGRP